MKLVEILARELVEWPEGDFSAVQDINGAVGFCLFPAYVRLIDGRWISRSPSEPWTETERKYELATDHATAIVTREQWQAERRRIEAAEKHAGQWSGEGLPPVGVECEFRHPVFGWTGCTVVGYFRHEVICAPFGGNYYGGRAEAFRPIDTRTPREKWIEAAMDTRDDSGDTYYSWLAAIFDAGLAKLPEDGE